METKDDILKELRELAPQLASLQKVNAYSVPESYFLNFKHNILEQVKPVGVRQELQQLAPSVLKIEKPLNAQLSATYFSDFSSKLLNKVRADEVAKELAVVAPRLSVLPKANIYKAPVNYFNAFPERALGNVIAQSESVVAAPRNWMAELNEFLDTVAAILFKPKYSVAFAGFTTTAIMAVFMFIKVEQCNDLECKFAQLSNDEISNYLDNKSDAYADEVFEMNLDIKSTNPNINNVHAYKDAMKDVDDAALNDAIAD